jgi:hypothetical protein
MKIEMDYKTRDNVINAGGFSLLWLTLASLVVYAFMAFTADHRTRRYYVGATMNPEYASCVKADNPWETDDNVMCSVDRNQVLEFAQKANEQLSRTR